MRGYSHAVTGAGAWTLVAAPEVPLSNFHNALPDISLSLHLIDVSPLTYASGLLLCAGAALLPDIDHHNGTIAHSLPKIGFIPSPTQALCRVIGKISGGHRHGTHSILGLIIFVAIAFGAGLLSINIGGKDLAIGSGIFAFLLTAFTLKVFHVGKSSSWAFRWLFSLLYAGIVTWYLPHEWNILPVIIGIGVLVHCLGDMLTVGGVPWLYPLKPKPPKFVKKTFLRSFWQTNGWFAFPILGKTDSGDNPSLTREKVLIGIITLYIVVVGVITGYYYISQYLVELQ